MVDKLTIGTEAGKVAVGTKGTLATLFGLRKVIFFSLMFVIFMFLILNSVVESINTRSVEPILTELGGRFLWISKDIEDTSRQIIVNEGLYDRESTVFGKTWDVIAVVAQLMYDLFILYMWIKVLTWIFAHSFLSDDSHKFVNVALAICTFYILEVVFVLVNMSVTGEIITYKDALRAFIVPVTCIITLARALPYFLSPSLDKLTDYKPNKIPLNETIDYAKNTSLAAVFACKNYILAGKYDGKR